MSSTQINLSWLASTDDVGVAGYKIFRNGMQVGTSTTTSYQDTTLSTSTSYSYTVSAYDLAGNNSAQSSSAAATTLAVGVSSSDDTNNIVLALKSLSYNSAPTPGFVGTETITVSIRNFGPPLSNPVFFQITQLDKIAPDLNPDQPDKLVSSDNQAGLTGDVQSLLSLNGLPTAASTDVTFQIGLGSRQQFTFRAALFGVLTPSSLTAADEIGKLNPGGDSRIGAKLLKELTLRLPESGFGPIPAVSNVAVIADPGSRSRPAVAIDPHPFKAYGGGREPYAGNVIVSTTNLGDRTAVAIWSNSILVAWTDTRQNKEDIYLSILPVCS